MVHLLEYNSILSVHTIPESDSHLAVVLPLPEIR